MQQSITLIPYTISWDGPADDGGSKIDKYQVRLAIHDGGYSQWIDLAGTDTRFVALLPNDVEITIEIRAVNDTGSGQVNTLQVRPVREPNPRDAKKQIADGSVNINLSAPPEIPENNTEMPQPHRSEKVGRPDTLLRVKLADLLEEESDNTEMPQPHRSEKVGRPDTLSRVKLTDLLEEGRGDLASEEVDTGPPVGKEAW